MIEKLEVLNNTVNKNTSCKREEEQIESQIKEANMQESHGSKYVANKNCE